MLTNCEIRSAASAHVHGWQECIRPCACAHLRNTLPAPAARQTIWHHASHVRHHAAQQHPTRQRLQPAAPSIRAQCRHSKRCARGTLRCRACQQQDAAAPADAVTAGIPLSGEVLTAPGQRLVEMLLGGSLRGFVPAVTAALQELAQPIPAASLQSPSVSDGLSNRLALARIHAVCEDIMYVWALAETYTADADMQREMRAALGRGPEGMLSDGSDGKRLRTSVQFLAGHEGQYRLGSVAFSADGAPAGSSPLPEAEQPADADVRLALDSVLASARGQSLMATEGSTPTRMDRDGAAKTYATYTSWGYFNRRMWVRRQLKLDDALEQADVLPDPQHPMVEDTSYGKTSAAWRFFEAVPKQLSDFRTPEAAAVADRHLRALFGNLGGECITTLAAWTTMCEEARSFGRALYDAEQVGCEFDLYDCYFVPVILDNLVTAAADA